MNDDDDQADKTRYENKIFILKELESSGSYHLNKRYQVFVSSTYKDLKEERSGVITAVLGIGCIPVAMEQFPAAPVSQWEYIKNMIDESDYIVLIVAGCYGTEDRIEKISFTEKEFNYAKEIGKPVLPFLIQNPESLSVSKSENSDSKRMFDK